MLPLAHHLKLVDFKPLSTPFCEEVLQGLTSSPKYIPSKFFYDKKGSLLFEEICTLPEYYPTRTETWILNQFGKEIAECIGKGALIIEFGSGSSTKTRLLLDSLDTPSAYMPIDISKEFLEESAQSIAKDYPQIEIMPVCADYSKFFPLPEPYTLYKRKVGFFPGSTIGNLKPEEAIEFLKRIAQWCGKNGGLLLGTDLKKDHATLERAYNDAQGVTAQFNLNLIDRINTELQPTPLLSGFRHFAFYNEQYGRIEMHLVSTHTQKVNIKGRTVTFAEGEHIITEYSHKYDLSDIQLLAKKAGMKLEHSWSDPNNLFSVHYLSIL